MLSSHMTPSYHCVSLSQCFPPLSVSFLLLHHFSYLSLHLFQHASITHPLLFSFTVTLVCAYFCLFAISDASFLHYFCPGVIIIKFEMIYRSTQAIMSLLTFHFSSFSPSPTLIRLYSFISLLIFEEN